MNDLSLLYIEDDEEIIENVTYLLSKSFSEIYTALNGESALELYKKHTPDIILTDISIGELDGLSVARKIRDNDKNIPIIIMSAYNNDTVLQTAKNIGVSSYIQKPFNFATLKEAIAKAIGELV